MVYHHQYYHCMTSVVNGQRSEKEVDPRQFAQPYQPRQRGST